MKKIIFTFTFTFIFISLSAYAFQIPDTGQTQSYTDTFGEDSDYTVNPLSYTKLDENGNSLPDSATEWTMVKDNVTGLVWEVKTASNKNDLYSWWESSSNLNLNQFIKNLNLSKFGGFSDWRIPTIKELNTLVHLGEYSPSINSDYFPNTQAADYWSVTLNSHASSGVFANDFDYGRLIPLHKPDTAYVRAVRLGKYTPGPFFDNGDGTITDSDTGLMWQQQSSDTTMSWEEAILYCEDLILSGYTDWRLPNQKELMSIVDYTDTPTINTIYFPYTSPKSSYWTSTTYAVNIEEAWVVRFFYGNPENYSKSRTVSYVRAVRSVHLDGNMVVAISATQIRGAAPLNVDFSITVNGGTLPYTYSWDFVSDGVEDSRLETPSYTYTSDGSYNTTVTVTDAEGSSASQSITIIVGDITTDTDNDGVPDIWDQCSNTEEDSFVNHQGCSANQLGLSSDCVATFDQKTNILHIPNFHDEYWLDFILTISDPVTLNLKDFGEIDKN